MSKKSEHPQPYTVGKITDLDPANARVHSNPRAVAPFGGPPKPQSEIDAERQPYLPADPAARKGIPLCTGVLDYFPLALAEVARVSKAGNDQHNPGQPLHWNRAKSQDQVDTVLRHLIERGTKDTDGMRHTAKAAWRILAELQIEMEQALGLPPSRGSKE